MSKEHKKVVMDYVRGLKAQFDVGNWHTQKEMQAKFNALHDVARITDSVFAYKLYNVFFGGQENDKV